MRKLVKVEMAFDLMDKDYVFVVDVDEQRIKGLLAAGYLTEVVTAEDLLVQEDESDLESTEVVGDPAPRPKRGKTSN